MGCPKVTKKKSMKFFQKICLWPNIKVTKAKNSCLVGLQGIVVMETRHTFQIIDKKSVVKNILKEGTSFTFALNGHLITIQGSSFMMKPSDRAVKKWKKKPTFDL